MFVLSSASRPKRTSASTATARLKIPWVPAGGPSARARSSTDGRTTAPGSRRWTTSQSSSLPLVSSRRPHDPMSATVASRSTGTSPSAARAAAEPLLGPRPRGPQRGERLAGARGQAVERGQRDGGGASRIHGTSGQRRRTEQKRASSRRVRGTCEPRSRRSELTWSWRSRPPWASSSAWPRAMLGSTAPGVRDVEAEAGLRAARRRARRAARGAGRRACARPCSRARAGVRAAARRRGPRACRGGRRPRRRAAAATRAARRARPRAAAAPSSARARRGSGRAAAAARPGRRAGPGARARPAR